MRTIRPWPLTSSPQQLHNSLSSSTWKDKINLLLYSEMVCSLSFFQEDISQDLWLTGAKNGTGPIKAKGSLFLYFFLFIDKLKECAGASEWNRMVFNALTLILSWLQKVRESYSVFPNLTGILEVLNKKLYLNDLAHACLVLRMTGHSNWHYSHNLIAYG